MNFDPIAPFYNSIESLVFQDQLIRAQFKVLKDLPEGSKVLWPGGGNARVIRKCGAIPKLEICFIDPSKAMLKRAEKAFKNYKGRVHLEAMDVLEHKEWEHYDHICLFFFLDIFEKEHQRVLLQHFQSLLKPKAKLHLLDFNHEGNQMPFRALLRIMYTFFRRVAGVSSKAGLYFWDELSHLGFTFCSRWYSANEKIRYECWEKHMEQSN